RVADLRQNGTLDVITLNIGSVSVLLGNGDGSFQSHVDYAAGLSPSALAVGDFNGDGIPDLAVADAGDSRDHHGGLRLLLGNGDGTFRPPVDVVSGSIFIDVAAADFNGDGNLDLVVSTDRSSFVTDPGVFELLGDGDGTFRAPTRIAQQTGPLAV